MLGPSVFLFKEGTFRAVHRLCVIGSPRGATEKFYAKRVIGSVFF